MLDLAGELIKIEGPSRRAGVNRAYYAAFHSLQRLVEPEVEGCDIGANGSVSHGAVLRVLRTWQSKYSERRLAMKYGGDAIKEYNRLVECKEAREIADYALDPTHDPSARHSVEIVGAARRILQFAKKVSYELPESRSA